MVAYDSVKRLVILMLVVAAACARHDSIPRLERDWQFVRTEPRSTPPGDDAAWQGEIDGDGQHDVWMRGHLPPTLPNGTHLVFRAYAGALTVFIGQTPVASFEHPAQRGRLGIHDVALPADAAGRPLFIRIPRAPSEAFFGTAPFLSSEEMLPATRTLAVLEPLHHDDIRILIALLLVFLGGFAASASLLRRRGDARTLLWFGVFTLLYGLRLAVSSALPVAFGVSLRTMDIVEAFITYVITIPGWLLAVRLIGPGWRSTLRLQVFAFALFAPVGILTDLATGRAASLQMVNNILVIAGGINILANVTRMRGKTTTELRVVLIGATLFLLLALNNNLSALGVLPWPGGDETVGFLLFVGALGFAAVRGFLRGERDQIALENELRTARDIQLSILPRTMPDVPGLHFHARYDPASSVAGDLYDFLRVDPARVGVLVADVAGHGVPAALVASMVKIAVTSQMRLASDPARMLAELDRTLRREVRRAFVTATYLWLDIDQRVATVTNAGHPPPLLFRAGTFLELGAPCVLLGRFADARFRAATTELQPGDRILAYTDGLVEARNARGEQFGEERIQDLVRRSTARDAASVTDDLVNAVRRWRVDDGDADDLTLVVIDVD